MKQQRSVLIVDDSPEDCAAFTRFLVNDPAIDYRCDITMSVAEGLERCRTRHFDAILLDYNLPDDNGLAFLAELIREHGPNFFAVLMITGLGDVTVAAAALKLGAHDYLIKGLQLERHLGLAIASAIEKADLQRKVEQQRQELEESNKQLRETIAQLDEERALLARRVEQRTADLSAANVALERALRLKDEFLANMSHELRTPLNAVLGRTESLLEEIYGPVTEAQQRALRSIDESGRHLLALIIDILDLSKIEAGTFELDIAETSVEVICRQSLRLVTQIALSKRIALSLSIDSDLQSILADSRRLKQILVNLLSNAIKFTPNDGKVGIEVVRDAERQTAIFTVWDTGIGIAAEDFGRLFQPFVQLDSALSRQYEGTGLGLALVRQLAEAHGGNVGVESTLGNGSRFHVTLPWQAAPRAAQPYAPEPAPRQPAQAGGGPLILLAEDNKQNAELVNDYLTLKGYHVVLARNGAEAIAQAHEHLPRVILMDIQMPGINGLEAIRRIRASAPLRAAKIIAVTALAMPGDRERCLEAGADEYLTKPISLSGLAALIAQHLAGDQPAASGTTAPNQ